MIDLTELYLYIFGLVAAGITAVVGVGLKYLKDKFNFELSDRGNRILNEYLDKGYQIMREKLIDNAEVDAPLSEKQAEMAQWVVDHAPKAMKWAGMNKDDVRRMVNRRLNIKGEK